MSKTPPDSTETSQNKLLAKVALIAIAGCLFVGIIDAVNKSQQLPEGFPQPIKVQ